MSTSLHLPDMEFAVEYAKYVLACSDQCPITFMSPSSGSSAKSKSIHQKLLDLYIEESMKQPENTNVLYASNLLSKLVKRERLNCMVLSLYPGNEGYSIMLKSRSGVESETMKLPYEESDILEYVDAAQLPPFLLDLLEKAQMNVFYSGCVVVEVRDYRRSVSIYDTQYVLLKPSSQSLLRDITAMSCDGHAWTQDDLFNLESELILATEEPLCLDPSPAVMLVENQLQYEQNFMNDPALKRNVKRYNQAAMNKKRKLAQSSTPKGMRLHDFLVKKKEKGKKDSSSSLSKARGMIDGFKYQSDPVLATPESIDVHKLAKVPESHPPDTKVFVEEHTLEREPQMERHMMAKITIFQPQLGDTYFGEFYLDYAYSPGKNMEDGRRCRFPIGSRQNVDRYLQQFRDLFTEEGKLQVKIAIQKENEPVPTIYYTPVMSQNPATAAAVAAAVNNGTLALSATHQGQGIIKQVVPSAAGATALSISNAQALMKQVQQQTLKGSDIGTVANLAAKRNIPIQLSLSISPAVSLPSSQAGILAQAPGSVGTLPTTVNAQFLASSIPVSTVVQNHRIKSQQPASSQLRLSSSSPLASPATISKLSTTQASALAGAPQIIAIPKAPTPTPAQTPPPNCRTPTPTPSGTRRSSTTDLSQGVLSQNIQHTNLASFIQGVTSTSSTAPTGESCTSNPNNQQQTGGLTNISLASMGNLPANINIQSLTGLPGVNIPLSGLQQVSLAQIAVPVPITMINTNSSILQGQAGLLGNSSSTTGSSSTTLVVAGLPASSSTASTTTSSSVSASHSSSSTTVLPQGGNILSLPMNIGGITQLMPVSSKGQGSQAIRNSSTVPFVQLQGQQGIQLLSLQQQRGQIKTGTAVSGAGQQAVARLSQGNPQTLPLSSVLSSPHMTALAVASKPGQGGTGPITAQQLIQLGQGSQLPTHVAFQKGQGSGGLQFHSVHIKPGVTLAQTQPLSSKPKKKRTNSLTPPK